MTHIVHVIHYRSIKINILSQKMITISEYTSIYHHRLKRGWILKLKNLCVIERILLLDFNII
jgi:hypothetical protein